MGFGTRIQFGLAHYAAPYTCPEHYRVTVPLRLKCSIFAPLHHPFLAGEASRATTLDFVVVISLSLPFSCNIPGVTSLLSTEIEAREKLAKQVLELKKNLKHT